MNGVTRRRLGDTDNNDGKDIIARLFAHPFVDTTIEPLQGLGLGVARTWGRETGTPRLQDLRPADVLLVGDRHVAPRRPLRISPQALLVLGPFGLLGRVRLLLDGRPAQRQRPPVSAEPRRRRRGSSPRPT